MNPPTGLTIRPMRPEDYAAVCGLWRAAGLGMRPTGRDAPQAFASQLRHFPTTWLVAESAGLVVGTVLGTHDQRKGWINRLAVHPEQRGRGLGRRLVAECEAALNALGIEIVAALIERGNAASLAAFRAAGFVEDMPVHYVRKRRRTDI